VTPVSLDSLLLHQPLPLPIYGRQSLPSPSGVKRLVIVGGGFSGVGTLKHLLKAIKPTDNLEVVLISDRNYFLYLPMLTEVTGGSVSPNSITTPLRDLCGNKATFVQAKVTAINLEHNTLILNPSFSPTACSHKDDEDVDNQPATGLYSLGYDYLVLAMGSVTNKSFVKGAAEHTLSLKDATDAMAIRDRVIEQFEKAVLETNSAKRRAMLTFAIAGGGFSGIELAGSLQDLLDGIRPMYPSLSQGEDSVVVVEGLNRILNELPESLATHSLRVLRQHGIRVQLGLFMTEVSEQGVTLQDGSFIAAETIVWTTGVAMSPVLTALDCPKDRRNRLVVNAQLEMEQHPGVFVLGDCAMIPDLLKPDAPEGQPPYSAPPTAQFAVREAKVAAANVLAHHRGLAKVNFAYKAKGEMAVIGHCEGVGKIGSIHLKGVLGWLGWRLFYLGLLPTWQNKIMVATDWFLSTFSRPATTRFTLGAYNDLRPTPKAHPDALVAKRTALDNILVAS
jgi:NADH:ubiquinone reductase (H+-translocating)